MNIKYTDIKQALERAPKPCPVRAIYLSPENITAIPQSNMSNLKHIDLFSGIGGFSLACEWAGIETILFCERDKFCQQILKKHWPDVPIIKDVKDVTKEKIKCEIITDSNGKRKQQQAWNFENIRGRVIDRNQDERLLLTAGFPCQPFSNAGRKRGANDDRYLWPETLSVIKSVRPDAIILENVAGILNMVFTDGKTDLASQAALFGNQNEEFAEYNTICGRIDSDLRQAGYETVWLVIPACSLGAPHRRDRVWIVATLPSFYSTGGRCNCWTGNQSRRPVQEATIGQIEAEKQTRDRRFIGTSEGDIDDSNADRIGLQGQRLKQNGEKQAGLQYREIPGWSEDWYEIAARVCTVDDGVSNGLARPRGWRVNALKAAGNSIVPAIAYVIIKALIGQLLPSDT